MSIIKEQEDRGRDATGIAWINGKLISLLKAAKSPEAYETSFGKRLRGIQSNIAIGHNRAATSNIIEKNLDTESHPFLSEDKSFALLQNGTVTNYEFVQMFLSLTGHSFSTGIDSEVLLHMFEEILASSENRIEAIKKFRKFVVGNVLIMFADGEVFGFPGNSAFNVINVNNGGWIIASEVIPLLNIINQTKIEPISFFNTMDLNGIINIKSTSSGEDTKILCEFTGKWDKIPLKEGTWKFNRRIMCDFCGKGQVPCEKFVIDKNEKDRCIECYRAGITKTKWETNTNKQNYGMKQWDYTSVSEDDEYCYPLTHQRRMLPDIDQTSTISRVSPDTAVAICCHCQLPSPIQESIFCAKCKRYFCTYDFVKHDCKKEYDDKFDLYFYITNLLEEEEVVRSIE